MRAPRVLLLALLVAAPALAGCAAPPREEPETPELRLFALDGRWAFDPATGAAHLARADAPAPVGALVLGEATGARAIADYAGLDADAAATLGVELPAPGEAHVSRAWAERAGVVGGDALTLSSYSWPVPYVATYFEMERVPPCDRRPDVKLCFLPTITQGEARLRLRVDDGGRDAAFLPDLVELGPRGRPAWWNGTFVSPAGEATSFSAHAPLAGDLSAAEIPGAMAAGDWTVTFTLESNGTLAAAGAAGIVRVREPGFLWFDDRLQQHETPEGQARAVLDNATPTHAELRVTRLLDDAPLAADIILALDDARTLSGTQRVTALLANLTPTQERALSAARGPDGVTLALRPRPLPDDAPAGDTEGALLFAAPADIDLAALPPVDGAGVPSLALATRPPVGEAIEADGAPLPADVLLLAHAAGPVPWKMPAGGRWADVDHALENLSRSRTLALASPDLLIPPVATVRLEIGDGNTTRSVVAIGGVEGGPTRALWSSAALVAGVGQPATPRLIVPLEPGADRDDVTRRVLDAWDHAAVARGR